MCTSWLSAALIVAGLVILLLLSGIYSLYAELRRRDELMGPGVHAALGTTDCEEEDTKLQAEIYRAEMQARRDSKLYSP
jgi:hypothetical protein